ncbi:MAG: aldehyde dehydrogenase family protein, partial [Halobacteriota archaeon]
GERAMRVAKALEAGMIYVNNFDREMLGAPFGGYKDSGMGRKLAFEETMREFTRVKNVRYGLGAATGLKK